MRQASRNAFAEELARHETALRAMAGDALYNVQFHLICDVLDVVEEVAGVETGRRVASALAARWADAPARMAEAHAAMASMPPLNVSDIARSIAGRDGASLR